MNATLIKTLFQKNWTMIIVGAAALGLVFIIRAFLPDTNPDFNSRWQYDVSQINKQQGASNNVNLGEALFLKVLRSKLDQTATQALAASLLTYNTKCATLDTTILGVADQIAGEQSASNMNTALTKVRSLNRQSFCVYFKTKIVDSIVAAGRLGDWLASTE